MEVTWARVSKHCSWLELASSSAPRGVEEKRVFGKKGTLGHSYKNVLIRWPKFTTIEKLTAMFGVNWRPTSSQHRLRPEVGTQTASLDLSLKSLWKGLDQNEQEWPQLMDLRRDPKGLLSPSVRCSKCMHCMVIRPCCFFVISKSCKSFSREATSGTAASLPFTWRLGNCNEFQRDIGRQMDRCK